MILVLKWEAVKSGNVNGTFIKVLLIRVDFSLAK